MKLKVFLTCLPNHSGLICSHAITPHRATSLQFFSAIFTRVRKVPRTAGKAWRPEGSGRGSLLLRGHCPQNNLWAKQACSQVNLFKLVSESNPAAHKRLLQAYYVQGMALNALWLSINAEVVGFHGG